MGTPYIAQAAPADTQEAVVARDKANYQLLSRLVENPSSRQDILDAYDKIRAQVNRYGFLRHILHDSKCTTDKAKCEDIKIIINGIYDGKPKSDGDKMGSMDMLHEYIFSQHYTPTQLENLPLRNRVKDSWQKVKTTVADIYGEFQDETFNSSNATGPGKVVQFFKGEGKVAYLYVLITGLIVLVVLFNMIMAPMFLFGLSRELAKNDLKKNKLNRDDVHYNTLRSVRATICSARDIREFFRLSNWSVKGNEYGFFWIIGLSLVIPVLSGVLLIYKRPSVRIFAGVMIVLGLVTAVLNATIYSTASCNAQKANKEYTDFNKFCANNIPIHQTRFLQQLAVSPSNTFEMETNLKAAFKKLDDKTDTATLAEALFAADMYAHYCKIDSYANISNGIKRAEALKLFVAHRDVNLNYIMNDRGDPPGFSDFMYSKNTMITNYSQNIGNGDLPASDKLPLSPSLSDAKAQADKWRNTANSMMQSFNAEANFSNMYYMAVALSFIQTFPVTLPLIYMYAKRSYETAAATGKKAYPILKVLGGTSLLLLAVMTA